ncbi:uncharacterized protein LOC142340117 [Convolutriloba macropyga]|uniref:uncharacterized protein LOC142340117 n=1 Tax=Convolutriloba macropyga TaxID=536237 RepID=UPI003F52623B
MPPSKDESAGDWYMNRGQQSVIYLPEIRENFLHKRIKHQRNVADWARYESKKMQLGHSRSSHSPSLEEESEYRRLLHEKQLALSKLKYRKIRQQIQETSRDRPNISSDSPYFSKLPLYGQFEHATTAPQYPIGSLSPGRLASFSPRRTDYSKIYPLINSTYHHLSPAAYSAYSTLYPQNYPYLPPVSTADPLRYSPSPERQFLSPPSNPALANQFLMDSLLTERALASYKMRFPRQASPPKGQYPKPFIAPTFSL